MLDSTTKRRIDACRDILVGKVPDPKSQVEQITIALIYKFMDDMDAEAEELGGKRSFFAGEYGKYGWARLMAPNQGGFDVLALYSEAIGKMNENPGIPALFRDIFKNAYLPYRDPETLRAFLKEIDGFTYDHSERLGDAFEYLLSVLGSQGDAGQFRTPRHIIDFMVEVIDPKKNESVLDPACGTAGFLISAWKHILRQNTRERAGDQLTPDERANLAANIHGYDISPDMVRLSLVNLYLHGFTDPHIVEYDTLTSEERWNETADVILANPPFMSPKGGIKPHKRFSVQATRSEVLFVDYMAEHLSPHGRAAIVVPEGIIFQSGTAYKKLREMLVKTSLVAVVSLPAGVFNPYSGVKTSILILDKRLARTCDSVLFVKVANDGFNLGAQRRAVAGNDLPEAKRLLDEFYAAPEKFENCAAAHKVARTKIGEKGEWNLSGDRYLANTPQQSSFVFRKLEDVFSEIKNGVNVQQLDEPGKYRVTRIQTISDGTVDLSKTKWTIDEVPADKLLVRGDILLSHINSYDHLAKTAIFDTDESGVIHGINLIRLRPNREIILPNYAACLLKSSCFIEKAKTFAQRAVNQASIKVSDLKTIEIPLPPLAIQQEIVAEIESYQKIIDGARQVVENYRPRIDVQPDWPVLELDEVAAFVSGGTPSKANEEYWNGDVPWVSAKDMKVDVLHDASLHISEAAIVETATKLAPTGSLLVLVRGMGLANGIPICQLARPCVFNQDIKAVLPKDSVDPTYLRLILKQEAHQLSKVLETAAHGTLKVNADDLRQVKLSLPPLATQRVIVAEIQAEQALVDANKQLIARFEAKIKATIDRVWGGSA